MDDLEAASLRSQSQALFQQGATFRRRVNGIAFTWNRAPSAHVRYSGAFSSLRRDQELGSPEPGGFATRKTCNLRVDLGHYPAFASVAEGDLITRSDTSVTLRVAAIAERGQSPEIVLTLADVTA